MSHYATKRDNQGLVETRESQSLKANKDDTKSQVSPWLCRSGLGIKWSHPTSVKNGLVRSLVRRFPTKSLSPKGEYICDKNDVKMMIS